MSHRNGGKMTVVISAEHLSQQNDMGVIGTGIQSMRSRTQTRWYYALQCRLPAYQSLTRSHKIFITLSCDLHKQRNLPSYNSQMKQNNACSTCSAGFTGI